MFVENHEDTLLLYGELFARAGYDVHALDSGEHAMRVIQGVRPAAVLLDIGLPGEDGISICRRSALALANRR